MSNAPRVRAPARPSALPRALCAFLGIFILTFSPGPAAGGGVPKPSDAPPDDTRAPRLERVGLKPDFFYIGEAFSDVGGGLRRRSVYLHSLSLTLSLDLGKLLGWRGATFFVYGMNLQGDNPSLSVGDAQGVSNIAAFSATKLYEAWIEQDLWGGRLSFLAGLYDLNSEFAVIESASVFINSSQAINPTFSKSGRNGPSIFPYTTLGIRARYKPSRRFYVQSAVLNGVAGNPDNPRGTEILFGPGNGVLIDVEAGWMFQEGARGEDTVGQRRRRRFRRYERPIYAGKVALGVWSYTARFPPLLGEPGSPSKSGNAGLYLLLAHPVWRSASGGARSLEAYARLGWANPRFNRFGFFAGGGLVLDAPFPGRLNDVAGIAVAAAFNGRDYLELLSRGGRPAARAEWDIELTYQARIRRWLAVQPDIQYVVQPNTDPRIDNAWALDLRLEISI
jgi:porin